MVRSRQAPSHRALRVPGVKRLPRREERLASGLDEQPEIPIRHYVESLRLNRGALSTDTVISPLDSVPSNTGDLCEAPDGNIARGSVRPRLGAVCFIVFH